MPCLPITGEQLEEKSVEPLLVPDHKECMDRLHSMREVQCPTLPQRGGKN